MTDTSLSLEPPAAPDPADPPRAGYALAVGPNPEGPDHQAALAQQPDAETHAALAATLEARSDAPVVAAAEPSTSEA